MYSIFVGVALFVGVAFALSFIGSTITSMLDMRGAWPDAPTGLIQRIGIIARWTWITLVSLRLPRQHP